MSVFRLIWLPKNFLSFRLALSLMLFIMLLGTFGYHYIEDYSWVDALYMTTITISTVGFSELKELSPAGRLFTTGFIVVNVLVFAYLLAAFSYYIIDGKIFESMFEEQLKKSISQLSDHTIVCGYGRYGQEIVTQLKAHRQAFVVIELNEEKVIELRTAKEELLYLIGDATQDDILEAAGIHRAANLITALDSDMDNLFIVLSGYQLNPKLRIVTRAKEEKTRRKMLKAGASHVIMPEQIGGYYMATLINKPDAVEFFSFLTNAMKTEFGFEEIHYEQLPAELKVQSIRELALCEKTGVNIVSYCHPDGHFSVNPEPSLHPEPGSSFIVLGTKAQLGKLWELMGIKSAK